MAAGGMIFAKNTELQRRLRPSIFFGKKQQPKIFLLPARVGMSRKESGE
jgi:hypothetical protein